MATMAVVAVIVVVVFLSWVAWPYPQRVLHALFAPKYTIVGGTIIMEAEAHDGNDGVWKRRPSAGTISWGIRGSGYPEGGTMWFDGFPGESGRYRVELGAVLELDGAPQYRVSLGGRVAGEGAYDYSCGVLMCNSTRKECPDKAVRLDLGTHRIERGDRVEVWGRSTYPCGKHGAYTRWFELRFTRADPEAPGAMPPIREE